MSHNTLWSVAMGYFAILAAVIGGYVSMPPWIIAASALALTMLSYAEHADLYRRANDAGLHSEAWGTLLRSGWNGLLAAGGGYGLGILIALAE
ncbi:MAG: hypothetical protein AAGJ70_00585 [Pseudomonadota bacterium]